MSTKDFLLFWQDLVTALTYLKHGYSHDNDEMCNGCIESGMLILGKVVDDFQSSFINEINMTEEQLLGIFKQAQKKAFDDTDENHVVKFKTSATEPELLQSLSDNISIVVEELGTSADLMSNQQEINDTIIVGLKSVTKNMEMINDIILGLRKKYNGG